MTSETNNDWSLVLTETQRIGRNVHHRLSNKVTGQMTLMIEFFIKVLNVTNTQERLIQTHDIISFERSGFFW